MTMNFAEQSTLRLNVLHLEGQHAKLFFRDYFGK